MVAVPFRMLFWGTYVSLSYQQHQKFRHSNIITHAFGFCFGASLSLPLKIQHYDTCLLHRLQKFSRPPIVTAAAIHRCLPFAVVAVVRCHHRSLLSMEESPHALRLSRHCQVNTDVNQSPVWPLFTANSLDSHNWKHCLNYPG